MSHRHFLLHALTLAKTRRGFCAPNPSVGSVVVKEGHIVAESVHDSFGSDHAEIGALKRLSYPIGEAILYVTLEPCCHWGKTPPCFEEIVRSGIKQIVYSYVDPNPLMLEADTLNRFAKHGIDCLHIPLTEIKSFYESYAYWTKFGRPVVTAKIAQSIDGKIAGEKGEPIRISGQTLNDFTHQKRLASDVILTTAETISNDNPRLNVRMGDKYIGKTIAIIDSRLSLTQKETVFDVSEKCIIFYDKRLSDSKQHDKKITYIPISSTSEGLDLNEILRVLGEQGCHDLWVELGGKCFTQFLVQRLLHRAYIYISPCWLGQNNRSAYQACDIFQLQEQDTISWTIEKEELIGLIEFKQEEEEGVYGHN